MYYVSSLSNRKGLSRKCAFLGNQQKLIFEYTLYMNPFKKFYNCTIVGTKNFINMRYFVEAKRQLLSTLRSFFS